MIVGGLSRDRTQDRNWRRGREIGGRDASYNLDALAEALGPETVRRDEPLARYTTLRVGGPADLLAVVESSEALSQAVRLAWDLDVPCRVLGAGSNILVSDAGLRGLVVLNRARAVAFLPPLASPPCACPAQDGPLAGGTEGGRVRAESGVALAALARQCIAQGLAGLEWAVGIPGTVGGAVVGNAGAWGSDVAAVLKEALVWGPDGKIEGWPVERFEYGYRTSVLKRQGIGYQGTRDRDTRYPIPRFPIVLRAEFALKEGAREVLEAKASEIAAKRKASQPPGATCGSVFKNPPGDYAGRLIEAAGLRGERWGRAEISPRHANFIVNRGGAMAADVKALIDLAVEKVQARFGAALELEIELVGDWDRPVPKD